MKDEDIERLLRALPRQKASAEFTPRLLKTLDRPPSHLKAWLRARSMLAGAGALLLLGAISSGAWHWYERRERVESARRIETLRNEYEVLEKDLEELRSLAAASQPVVEVGGTEDVDIFLDLRTLAASTGSDRQAQRQPIDYRR
jgi:type II secretory pathway component PulM